LFVDAERLGVALVQRILDAADVASPLRAVVQALAGFDWPILGHANRNADVTR